MSLTYALFKHGLFTHGLHVWHMVCMLMFLLSARCCHIVWVWVTHGLLTHGLQVVDTRMLLTQGLNFTHTWSECLAHGLHVVVTRSACG